MLYTNLKFQEKLDLKSFLNNETIQLVLKNHYGIEREMVRTIDNECAYTPHPEGLGSKSNHPYITTDFSESQIEVITGVHCCCINSAVEFANNLYEICVEELPENQFLWPFSMPPKVNTDKILEAQFYDNIEKTNYRQYLSEKYGKGLQMICGVHFNFSFADEVIEEMRESIAPKMSLKDFKSEVYLKLLNNYLYFKYLVTVFLSATPYADETLGVKNSFAIRSSKNGYVNKDDLPIDYSSIDNYVSSVKQAIDDKLIEKEFEIYESIRLKTGKSSIINSINEHGVKYVEIRNIDINPYKYGGIDTDAMKFIEQILIYCTFSDIKENVDLHTQIANSDDVTQYNDIINSDMNKIIKFYEDLNCDTKILKNYLADFNKQNLLTHRIKNDIDKSGYLKLGMQLGNKHKEDAQKEKYGFSAYKYLELSTQIVVKKAIKLGVQVEVVDKSDNIIKLQQGENIQYVKQATKTSLDDYVSVELMGNKYVTNKILTESGIRVPKGNQFSDVNSAVNYAYKLGACVIKPKSTNYGVGINIFKESVDKDALKEAVEYAFQYDNSILVEEFINGNEFRFLVIGNSVVAVIERVPANVVGDGSHTIQELIDIKNTHLYRGENYVKPLEIIKVDKVVHEVLHSKNLNLDTVLKSGEQVYIRNNSNISTGGDTIDRTDDVAQYYKTLAISAAKTFKVNICGIDIISGNFSDENAEHAIIELNYNPAIQMHTYPLEGKSRDAAKAILEELGYEKC